MKSYTSKIISAAALATIASACNPLQESNCSPDPALGTSLSVDLTKGASSSFSTTGGPVTYGSNGAVLTVDKTGIAPTLISNFYIMFGRFEVVMQTAPGCGMVSSAILQSDDLDEIDWEILGATPAVAQTNYFGKGLTTSYDREVDVADATSQTAFNTYVIDWSADSLVWSINGNTLRTLTPQTADANQYPQTPMQIKIGPWSGGDPNANQPGTVAWAEASTGCQFDASYNGGKGWSMYIKSINVQDYSTGSEYKYNGTSGTWESMIAVNGAITGAAVASGSGSSSSASSSGSSNQSSTTSASSSAPYTNSSKPSTSAQSTSTTTTAAAASSTNTAAAQMASSLRSEIAASASAQTTGMPAAGAVTAVTATTFLTTAEPQGSSTITKVVAASAASSATAASGSTTTHAASSSTSSGLTLQTGNAAVRTGLTNAAAIIGAAAGVAAYIL